MVHPISISLWGNQNAREAADFYATVFPDFKLISVNPITVLYQIGGRNFMHINAGPEFPINPSISFFYESENAEELKGIWDKLSEGGSTLMPFGEYPWSKQYGWCGDRFGVNWQLMLGNHGNTAISPSLMFHGANNGKTQEAIDFYTGLFPQSSTQFISRYEKGEPDIEGNIKYSRFLLNGGSFSAMDSSYNHQFQFNEGVSLMVTVDSQEEIDHYWQQLSDGGSEGKCGWLKDKYGVSWQVIPSVLGKLMSNPEQAAKTTAAFMKMGKMVIADLM
jgi:predicted 3-demethylubiquinone-9 3-methyltransferase (glyoxalase superfamily)